ncbi:MAG: hypothetical protein AAF638_10185 [Pseudomonadota bacterium]
MDMTDTDGFAQQPALPAPGTTHLSRFGLIRTVIVFQIKLFLDGLRDVIMSPMSIMAGIIGILFGGNRPDWAFQRLMRFGRRTDVWINLFDAYPEGDPDVPQREKPVNSPLTGTRNVDEAIAEVEDLLRRDYAAGGITARSRRSIEDVLDRLRDSRRSA